MWGFLKNFSKKKPEVSDIQNSGFLDVPKPYSLETYRNFSGSIRSSLKRQYPALSNDKELLDKVEKRYLADIGSRLDQGFILAALKPDGDKETELKVFSVKRNSLSNTDDLS